MTPAPTPGWLRAGLAAILLQLLLIQPNRPSALDVGTFLQPALELPVILLAMLALGDTLAGRVLRAGITLALTAIFVLRTTDFVSYLVLGRRFNPISDMFLVDAAFRLVDGSFGRLATIGVAICVLLLILGVAAAIWWATGVWARIGRPAKARGLAVAGLALALTAMAVDAGLAPGSWGATRIPGSARATRYVAESVEQARATMADLREFAEQARNDDLAGRDGLLDAIDRDILVIFVESYGRTSLDTPYFAETHRATLDHASDRLAGLGLATRSAYLEAPTTGGQSWLSHATLANGLWVDDQSRYQALLASGRESLFHLAGNNGFRTAAVVPAITMAWPEAESMGFETVLAAKDLGYRGKPFNWVTMPDQFTLTALDRLLREGSDDRLLIAEVDLVSSHAPWVPVPKLLDWAAIGDGSIFDEMATSGDPPKVVWRDPERVRAQYRKAIDYSLNTVFDYAALHAGNPPLLIVLGDHQTAASIAQDERAQVPIHVIGPPSLVSLTDSWGWKDGLVPAPEPVIPMDRMRDMILRSFTTFDLAGGEG